MSLPWPGDAGIILGNNNPKSIPMKSFLMTILAIGLSCTSAIAAPLSSSETLDGKSGYPCFEEMTSASGQEFTLQIYQDDGIWSLKLFVGDIWAKVGDVFKASGYVDEKKVDRAFPEYLIGDKRFEVDRTWLPLAQRKELGPRSVLLLEIKTKRSISAALDAMDAGTISVPRLGELEAAAEPMTRFAQCARKEIGLTKGTPVAYDARARYQILFEKNLKDWLAAGFTADACGQRRFSEADARGLISRAADAFFPGLLNVMKRRDYVKKQDFAISLGQTDGAIAAYKGNCMGSGMLHDVSQDVMEEIVTSAAKVD